MQKKKKKEVELGTNPLKIPLFDIRGITLTPAKVRAIERGWNKLKGPGNSEAREGSFFNVIIANCTREKAYFWSEVVYRYIGCRSCCYYDGQELRIFCGANEQYFNPTETHHILSGIVYGYHLAKANEGR